jgi:hypothetical protein
VRRAAGPHGEPVGAGHDQPECARGVGASDPRVREIEDAGPLRAAHTPNFPALLRALAASPLVTTYQAGKLVMVRDEGDHLTTHYRAFRAPMGLALADGGSRPSKTRQISHQMRALYCV